MNMIDHSIDGPDAGNGGPSIEFAIDELREAFAGIAERKAPGADEVTKELYAQKLDSNLDQLNARLRSGSYQPNPVLRTWVRKPSGGRRPIAKLCTEDKIVQRALLRRLASRFEPHFFERSFARPGWGPLAASEQVFLDLLRHKPRSVVQLDIERCFETIDHGLLTELIAQRVGGSELALLKLFLAPTIVDEEQTAEDEGDVAAESPRRIESVREVGIEQGMPLSTFLANVFLHHALDEWLENESSAVSWARYVDDVVACVADDASAEDLLLAAEEQLASSLLTLNASKSQVIRDFDPRRVEAMKPGDVDLYGGFDFVGTRFRPARTKSGSYFVETYRDRPASSDGAPR